MPGMRRREFVSLFGGEHAHFQPVQIKQFGTQVPQGGHPPHHSITSSARARSEGGTSINGGNVGNDFTQQLKSLG